MPVVLEKMSSRATQSGVGFSQNADVVAAAEEAVVAALATLQGSRADALLVFATVAYDQERIVAEVTQRVPSGVPVVGCSGEGVICHGYSFEQTHALVVVAFCSSRLQFTPVFADNLSDNEERCGAALAEQVAQISDARVLLLFPDGLAGNVSRILPPLDARCPDVTILGGTAGDMLAFEKTYQYANGNAVSNAVCGLVISGPVEVAIEVNHGCRPVGRELTITESDGHRVRRIDDRPAWEVMQDYVGERDEMSPMDMAHLALGRRVDVQHSVDYGDYVIRMPLGVDLDSGEVLFPGGLDEGTVVRLTRRDPRRISTAVERAATALHDRAEDAFIVLQFDCAGRGVMLFGDTTTASIAAPIQNAFGNCPVVGLHTFGEIAPLGDTTEFHNYTVALVALMEKP